MPTFASMQVHVTPQTLTTTLSLDDIHRLLSARPPQGSAHARGWRGITDDLERAIISDDPGSSPPTLVPGDPTNGHPERVYARHVWWDKRPVDGGTSGQEAWFKEGVDVIVSYASGNYMLLWSTNDSRLINDTSKQAPGAAVEALLSAVRAEDATASISSGSVLAFDREAYLWLTNAAETKKDIGGGVRVTSIAGMGTDERVGRMPRSAKLDGSVDFERISFISAIGTGSELGPADVTFTERNADGRVEHTAARINTNGSAKLLTGGSHYQQFLPNSLKRLEVAERLAYRYLPLVRDGFTDDKLWGKTARDRLIVEKQVLLSKVFRKRAQENPQYAAWVADGGDINAPL